MTEAKLQVFELEYHITFQGKAPLIEWLKKLDKMTKAKVIAKIDHLSCGHFSNCKSVGHKLYELKIDLGPGYRIYYSQIGKKILLLLLGGKKETQKKDIQKAKKYLQEYRKNDDEKKKN